MRIAFFLRHPFHEAILRPVANVLRKDHQCQVFKTETRPTADDPFSMAPLRACIGDMVRYRPHVILSGEDIGPLHMRNYFPATLFVHTRHGLVSICRCARASQRLDLGGGRRGSHVRHRQGISDAERANSDRTRHSDRRALLR